MAKIQLSPFNRKIFDETFGLLLEARSYAFGTQAEIAGRHSVTQGGLDIVGEQLRITARLAAVMGWLLYDNAIDANDAIDSGHLDAMTDNAANGLFGVTREPAHGKHVPPILRDLALRSERLYARVSRLDAMAQLDAEASAA